MTTLPSIRVTWGSTPGTYTIFRRLPPSPMHPEGVERVQGRSDVTLAEAERALKASIAHHEDAALEARQVAAAHEANAASANYALNSLYYLAKHDS